MLILITEGQAWSPLQNQGMTRNGSLHNTGQTVNGKTGKVNADINWNEAIQIYNPQKKTVWQLSIQE